MKPSFTHNTVLQITKSEELVKEPSTLNHQPVLSKTENVVFFDFEIFQESATGGYNKINIDI
jgi:hypothetical protein